MTTVHTGSHAATTASGTPTLTSDAQTVALDVRGVSKRFGETLAVDGVDLVVHDQIVALVGPSGCGKSTLLRMIAGLEHADAGTITLAGDVVDDADSAHARPAAPEQRHVGLVFQEHALFPHLTVERNVAFGLRRDHEPSKRVAEMLELVGLGGYGTRYPHELSGGERQRVALARALAPHPSLLLLDEPFASLDPNLRARLRHDIVEILRATATPTVFVTHDQSEALAAGDLVAVMRAGRVVQLADAESVFHTPANTFVAAFMGEADFLTAADLAAIEPGATWTSTSGTAMVRPDDVTFDLDAAGTATIIDAEFRGTMWCYTLQLGTGTTVRSTRSHLERVQPGAAVTPRLVAGHRPVPVEHG